MRYTRTTQVDMLHYFGKFWFSHFRTCDLSLIFENTTDLGQQDGSVDAKRCLPHKPGDLSLVL